MKFTDARRTMKSVQFMYSDEFLDSNETTYDSIDQSQLGNGQEFTFAGKIKEKVLGTFKTVSNDLKITDPNGEERIIEQKYIVSKLFSHFFREKSRTYNSNYNCLFSGQRDHEPCQFEIRGQKGREKRESQPCRANLQTSSHQTTDKRATNRAHC